MITNLYGKSPIRTCQDCHMRDVTGYGCNKNGAPLRTDLPLHDLTGGNTFIPTLVQQLYPDKVDPVALAIGESRARVTLQNAALLEVSSVTTNQQQRAAAYTDYVRQALENDRIVGAHWFQLTDQLVTGRGDGECYQIGFLDIVDRPYPEMVEASRMLGEYLYPYRRSGISNCIPRDPVSGACGLLP